MHGQSIARGADRLHHSPFDGRLGVGEGELEGNDFEGRNIEVDVLAAIVARAEGRDGLGTSCCWMSTLRR